MINGICHLTSVHPRHDMRIFYKECRSLATVYPSVSLLVADGKGDEFRDGVSIVDVGAPRNRMDRITKFSNRIFKCALELNSEVYHIHDPELLHVGLRLKRLGKKVIFDAHEDFPLQLASKPYLNRVAKLLLPGVFATYESFACSRFDGVIAATPDICNKFLSINVNTVEVCNFPIVNELVKQENLDINKRRDVCYVGVLEKRRGIREMIEAIHQTKCGARLQLAGRFYQHSFEEQLKSLEGWQSVDDFGWQDRSGVREILNRSVAGLVTLHPVSSYINSLPTKMFEYMSAGIPVIASDFPMWRDIVQKNSCGMCVDPLDPAGIGRAIDYLVRNPDVAREMGSNGRKAVLEKFNWSSEEEKLLEFYESI